MASVFSSLGSAGAISLPAKHHALQFQPPPLGVWRDLVRRSGRRVPVRPERVEFPVQNDFVSSDESIRWQDTRTLWRRMVRNYSSRSITQKDDRLAGISRVFARIYGLTYVAGLFIQHMPAALLWRVDLASINLPNGRAGGRMVAPSWSWLSMPAECRGQLLLDEPTVRDEPIASISFDWHGSSTGFGTDASFHDFDGLQLTVRAGTFYGSITGEWLKIDVPVSLFSDTSSIGIYLATRWNDTTATLNLLVAPIKVYESSDWLVVSCLRLLADGREQHWRRISTCSLSFTFAHGSREPGQLTHLLKSRQRELILM